MLNVRTKHLSRKKYICQDQTAFLINKIISGKPKGKVKNTRNKSKVLC